MTEAALAVLDFSGTLSIDAVRFAAPDRIAAELQRAGLWSLGLDSPALFWEQVIDPTWVEGSTTTKGYLAVLSDAVAEVLRTRGRDVRHETIERCSGAFAARYFACSTIAPQWRRYLRHVIDRDDATVVVATDHYPEATAHISAELTRLSIPNTPVLEGRTGVARAAIANSADLGCHKASARYWQVVARALHLTALSHVVVIDDFGANEAAGAAYADPERVARRRAGASTLLSDVFALEPEVFAFTLQPDATAVDIQRLVDDAERFTMNVLSTPSGLE
jgi:hypothetical protein